MRRASLICALVLAGSFAALWTGGRGVHAAGAFVVDSFDDAVDAQLGDGLCATAAGACTLRAAIQEANALPGADRVDLPAGTYTLSLPLVEEDDLAGGDLDIADHLTIVGAGRDVTVVDGGGLDRTFQVYYTAEVRIEGVTFRNGKVVGRKVGGGVINEGTLTLVDCAVVGNRIEAPIEGRGGGIYNGGVLLVEGTVVANNYVSTYEGGGIYNREGAEAHLLRTEIAHNVVSRGEGGGVSNDGLMVVEESSVVDNHAYDSGAGFSNGYRGELTLKGVQVSANRVGRTGGGIYNHNKVSIERSEIARNLAAAGGGIYNGEPAVLTIHDSELKENGADYGAALDSQGVVWLVDVVIEGNRAKEIGAGIFVWDRDHRKEKPLLTFERVVFRGNVSDGVGGGVANSGGYLAFRQVTFEDNRGISGGAIGNWDGIISLSDCVIRDNVSPNYGGGAFTMKYMNPDAVVKLNRCLVSGNTARFGGGLANELGELVVEQTTVEGNAASEGGGGVYNFGQSTLEASTVHGNSAPVGGGIFNEGDDALGDGAAAFRRALEGLDREGVGAGVSSRQRRAEPEVDGEGYTSLVRLLTSTVSGNQAGGRGGAVFNGDALEITTSTLAENTATEGAALFNLAGGSAQFVNSILVGGCSGEGGFTSLGHNLEDGASCGFDGPGDLVNSDPSLGPLIDNGGFTDTHALHPDSPAIDAGDDQHCGTSDQRGVYRPLDGDGDGEAICDIGAYEEASQVVSTFEDVPVHHWAYPYIEALAREKYVAGCGAEPRRYCPEQGMARSEAAVFVVRGVHTSDYTPPDPTEEVFADVPREAWFAKWVYRLWAEGFTTGCGVDSNGDRLFCPSEPHTTRAEATVFFLRMVKGADYFPGPEREVLFDDVPFEAWYAKWVYAAAKEGLIEGCEDSSNRDDRLFRPEDPLARAEAACMMWHAVIEKSPESPPSSSSLRLSVVDLAQGSWASPISHEGIAPLPEVRAKTSVSTG